MEYERSLNGLGVPWHIASDGDRVWSIDESMDHSVATYAETMKEYESGDGMPPGLLLSLVDKGVPADEG